MMDVGYIDVNPNPDNTYGDLVYDDAAIIVASLSNLFRCWPGNRGRIFQPAYFSRLYDILQEPVDQITADTLRLSIIQSIDKWEPRVRVISGRTGVVPDYTLPGYHIVVAFRILATSKSTEANFQIKQFGGG